MNVVKIDKTEKAFLMLKPESAEKINIIESYLEKYNQTITGVETIEDYKDFAMKIYSLSHLNEKSHDFEQLIACIELSEKLYNNRALILHTEGSANGILDYLEKLDKIKSIIRTNISPYKERVIHSYLNIDKIQTDCILYSEGSPKIVDKHGNILKTVDARENQGKYISFYLGYLHSPDIDINLFEKQSDFIKSQNLRKLSENEMQLVKRFKTYNI